MRYSPLRFSQYARDLSKAVQDMTMPTIAEQLKAARAQVADARQAAAAAVTESAEASRVVLQEVDKARKEAADLRAEVAELTNGGPAIEPTETQVPSVGPYPSYP